MATYDWSKFSDVGEGLFKSHPMELVKADAGAAALVRKFTDYNDRPGVERWVKYNNGTDSRLLCLRMVQAAVDLTVLTTALAAADCQDSNDPEGRLLHSDGTMKASSAVDVATVQGLMFDEYYVRHKNRLQDMSPVTTIEANDLFWVIVEGPVQLQAGEGGVTAVGDLLVTDADGTHSEGGRVRSAATMSVPPTAAEVLENTARKAFAMSREATVSEGSLFLAHLALRQFGYKVTTFTEW